MIERRANHLSEEQLAQFQDGRLPAWEASHLEACCECGARLRDLGAASAAYREYLVSMQGPAIPPTPRPWRSLDSLIAEHETRRSRRAWRWWMVPALGTAIGFCIVIGVAVHRTGPPPSIQANELLGRSATVELPTNRMISLRVSGRPVLRPAVLLSNSAERDSDLAHLAMLFDEAGYSWQEPLSARSFQAWRGGLGEKRDSVSAVHSGGSEPAYRVRTETTTGVLHSASLILRGTDLHATQGAFEFAGEEPVDMEESDAAAPSQHLQQPPVERRLEPKPVRSETPASPADRLHVLAALNRIGADVGEPIEITEDTGHQVLIRAAGLSPERARQVAEVLEPLPHVRIVNGAPDGTPSSAKAASVERSSSGIPGRLRQRFENRLGGAVAFQEATDRVLEASGLAVARAHALDVLAVQFPPQTEAGLAEADRVTLRHLRQVHLAALDDLTARIASDLEALLPKPVPDVGKQLSELVAAAQQLDDSLNRLLAGSYSEPLGESLVSDSARQMAELRRIIDLRKERGR